jgi:antitoxin component YwqK of YwqJK toxin-antitoxin module
MNRILLTIAFVFAFLLSQSQEIQLLDGRYYEGNNLFTGTFTQYDQDGNIIAILELKKGRLHGTSKYYTNNILVENREFKHNLKNGLWEKFNGDMKTAEARYHRDRKHGKWLIWDDNGLLRFEMFYKNGKKTGTWRMWDENGILQSEKKY